MSDNFFGKNEKEWNWADFKTTKGFLVPKELLDWVIGQSKALEETKLCIDEWVEKLLYLKKKKYWKVFEKSEADKPLPKEWLPSGPFLLLLGDAGTGKSLIGRALSTYMTNVYRKKGIELNDVLSWKNESNPSEPKISIHPAGEGKKLSLKLRLKALKKNRFMKWGFRLLQGLMIGFGLTIIGLVLYFIASNWLGDAITQYGISVRELYANNFLQYLIDQFMANAMVFYMGIGAISMGAMIFIFKNLIGRVGNIGGKGGGGAESLDSPKLIIDNSNGKAPFIDATGHTTQQLFGSISWTPFGTAGPPEHQRVVAGAVHRAHLGILYIDEIKNLIGAEAVTLLTVLEDGQLPITLRSQIGGAGGSAEMAVSTEPVPSMNFFIAAGNMDCYSDDTDVLSEYGLVRWNELKVGDKVWSLNVETKEMELKPIKRIPIYNYDGKMLHLHGKQYDNLTTPNHRILLYKKHGGYRDVPSSHGSLEYESAEKAFKHWTFRLPTTAKWIGQNPKIEFVKDIDKRANKLPTIKIEDLYELIGWYCSEGSLDHKRRYVIISNTERRELLFKLLSSIPLTYYPKNKNVILPYQQLYYFFKDFGYYCNEKRIPRYILSAKIPSLIRLFKGLMHGDGSKIDEKYYAYYTTSSFLRDAFIEICFKLGFHTTVKTVIPKKSQIRGRIINSVLPQYHLYVQRQSKGYVEKKENMEWVNYKGKIWCYEVEDNNNFLVGRNGKLCFSGNSVPQIHPALMDRIAGYGKIVYMNNDMSNTVENRRKCVQFISQEIKRFNLLPFSREACIEIIEEFRRKSGRKDRLVTKFRPMISIIKTASIVALNRGLKVAELQDVREAIDEHCKSIHRQVLERFIETKKVYAVIDSDAKPKIGQIHAVGVTSSEGSKEMIGSILPIRASIQDVKKKQKGYFHVTGVKTSDDSWVQHSILKVRHVINQLYGLDPADKKTHVDFAQQIGVDGPSAGVAMTLALVSILEKKPLRQDVAVTGEVNIGVGKEVLVTPIGGTHEKIMAAQRLDFKKVLIPNKNFKYDIRPKDYEIKIVGCATLEDYKREILNGKN